MNAFNASNYKMGLFRKYKVDQLSDEQLVQLYRRDRNSDSIAELYVRYGHLVFGTCMKYLKNKENAEDISMQLFEKLPLKLMQNEIKYFKSWLYMVTKNECLMYLRKKKEVPMEFIQIESEEETINPKIILESKLSLLEKAIELLKSPQKECIKLFYIEDNSYEQIASLLKLEIKKVKSAIQNGKRNIKLILEDNHEFKSLP